jgi:hypothetical protein
LSSTDLPPLYLFKLPADVFRIPRLLFFGGLRRKNEEAKMRIEIIIKEPKLA